jgi:hypothetical protein
MQLGDLFVRGKEQSGGVFGQRAVLGGKRDRKLCFEQPATEAFPG